MAGSSRAIIQKSKDHLVEPWEIDHKCSGASVSSITFKNYRTLFSLNTKMFFEEQLYGYFISCHLKYMFTCETTEIVW
jgi:hypothetical protein